jgi:hypothetical protein
MRVTHTVAALSITTAVGLSFGSVAQAEPTAPSAEQVRLANTTQNLEQAFNEQFVKGSIDRAALAGPIEEVVQAMPQPARPKVQTHIDQVLQTAEKLVGQMNPEERAQAAAPVAAEKIGATSQAQIAAWGWPGGLGWGGLGAFGFPGMYGTGLGWGGLGWGGLGWGGMGGWW